MRLMDLIKHILIGWQSNYLFPFSPLSTSERGLSLSNHLQIFINCRFAQITNPRKFAHIHLPCYIGGIMFIENLGNIIFICRPAPDLPPLCFGICHSAFYSCSDISGTA